MPTSTVSVCVVAAARLGTGPWRARRLRLSVLGIEVCQKPQLLRLLPLDSLPPPAAHRVGGFRCHRYRASVLAWPALTPVSRRVAAQHERLFNELLQAIGPGTDRTIPEAFPTSPINQTPRADSRRCPAGCAVTSACPLLDEVAVFAGPVELVLESVTGRCVTCAAPQGVSCPVMSVARAQALAEHRLGRRPRHRLQLGASTLLLGSTYRPVQGPRASAQGPHGAKEYRHGTASKHRQQLNDSQRPAASPWPGPTTATGVTLPSATLRGCNRTNAAMSHSASAPSMLSQPLALPPLQREGTTPSVSMLALPQGRLKQRVRQGAGVSCACVLLPATWIGDSSGDCAPGNRSGVGGRRERRRGRCQAAGGAFKPACDKIAASNRTQTIPAALPWAGACGACGSSRCGCDKRAYTRRSQKEVRRGPASPCAHPCPAHAVFGLTAPRIAHACTGNVHVYTASDVGMWCSFDAPAAGAAAL